MAIPHNRRLPLLTPIGLAFASGLALGCQSILGIHDVERDTSGGGAGGRDASSGASVSGEGGAGGSGTGGAAGTGGSAGGDECSANDERCSENTPQRCVDGRWEDETPCPAATPSCAGGECVPTSCVGLAKTCGPGRNEGCCTTAMVTGGSFNRSNDAAFPATVSGFLLDRFEVTVGRFRKFMEVYPGSKPEAGAGRHPLIAGSGWDANWDANLPPDAGTLKAAVKCNLSGYTWRDDSGDGEHLPINCLNWYEAFAFCAWDDGRLPTETEWNYAAAGGGEQREHPWSNPSGSTMVDGSYAVYDCTGDGSASGSCAFSDIQPVGSRSPRGDGRWKQADLAGNMWEWILDWYVGYSSDCTDCANLETASIRVVRGGSWDVDASSLRSSRRDNGNPTGRNDVIGVRCARTP
ncbi:formylglycine-generating enzyme family protein [Sorangium sp. So ce118]